jgi:hypothetical protein
MHFVTPLVDSVALYDTREQVYSTAASATAKSENEVLVVQAREGLNIGLAVSVRYVEAESDADSEDYCGEAFAQAANHDGADWTGRIFLRTT